MEALALAHILVLRNKLISAFFFFFFFCRDGRVAAPYSFFVFQQRTSFNLPSARSSGANFLKSTSTRKLTPTIRPLLPPDRSSYLANKPCLQSMGKKNLRRSELHTKQRTKSGPPINSTLAAAAVEMLQNEKPSRDAEPAGRSIARSYIAPSMSSIFNSPISELFLLNVGNVNGQIGSNTS